MPAPYSVDLRERALNAYATGEYSLDEVADLFGVSVAWIKNIRNLHAETGSLEPRPPAGGRKRRLDEEQQAHLSRLLAEQPDATLAELRDQLTVRVSLSTLSVTLAGLGFSRKKSLFTRASGTAKTLSKSGRNSVPASRKSTFTG
jgi:transposase